MTKRKVLEPYGKSTIPKEVIREAVRKIKELYIKEEVIK